MNTLTKSLLAAATALLCSITLLAQQGIQGDLHGPQNGGLYTQTVTVTGWAANWDAPSRALTVRIMENGQMLYLGTADLQVQGLAAYLGEGNDLHGFHVTLEGLAPGPHDLTVWVQDPVTRQGKWLANPVSIEVTTLSGQFTSPEYGIPVSTRFHLRGVLQDMNDPGRVVQGLLRYHSNLDNTVIEVPLTADQPDDLGGNHGFDVLLELPSQRHWYMRLLVLDRGQELFADFINLDTFCLPAFTGGDRDTCPGQPVQLGYAVPDMSGEEHTFLWSPAYGLDDPAVSNPIASPEQTTRYTFTVTDPGNFCEDVGEVVVRVHQGDVIATASTPHCAANGEPAVMHLDGEFNNPVGDPPRFYWDFDSDQVADYGPIDDPAVDVLAHAGTYTSTLYMVLGPGCVYSDQVTFTVDGCQSGPGCAPRTVGYWQQQFDGEPAQKEDACAYIAELETSSLVFFDMVDSTDPCATMADILSSWGGGTMWEKAVRQSLGLWLNLLSGKVDAATSIDLSYAPVTTVGDALSFTEAVLTNPAATQDELELVKDLADALNNSCGYTPGCAESCGLELMVSKAADGSVQLSWSRGEGPDYLVTTSGTSGTTHSQHDGEPVCGVSNNDPDLVTFRVAPVSP